MKFIDQVPRFALKTRILEVVPQMVMPPSFAKSILILSLTGSEPLLVEIRESTYSPHTLLEVCPAHKDKVEIKRMVSVGGKTPTKPKFYSFFSNLRHMGQDEVDVMRFIQL